MKKATAIFSVSFLALAVAGVFLWYRACFPRKDGTRPQGNESVGVIDRTDDPNMIALSVPGVPSFYWIGTDFLDCIIPAVSIHPPMTLEDAMRYLEKVVLNPDGVNGIDGKGYIMVQPLIGQNFMPELPTIELVCVPVRDALAIIAEKGWATCRWNSTTRMVSFLMQGKLTDDEWKAFTKDAGIPVEMSKPILDGEYN